MTPLQPIHSFALIPHKLLAPRRGYLSHQNATPLLISHRGVHDELPENSIPAFRRAVELGADAIELDVHATSDGKVVVHHDFAINAGGVPRPLTEMSYDELSRHTLAGGARIPTLEEVLKTVGNTLMVYVEIKAPNIEPLVVRVLRESTANSAVHSFDHRIVLNVKRLFPAIRTGVLQVARHIDPIAALRATGASDLWQHVDYIDEELVAATHDAGGSVVAWTANDPAQWKTLRKLGVDAICTDRVAALAAELAKSR